ncbi:MAG: hypothetical protein LBS74_08920 [Oscillospiraceae bacterium]|jgi:hypothetical protein|nr:hypothetical protein [Oscillospiraceae bacterium]
MKKYALILLVLLLIAALCACKNDDAKVVSAVSGSSDGELITSGTGEELSSTEAAESGSSAAESATKAAAAVTTKANYPLPTNVNKGNVDKPIVQDSNDKPQKDAGTFPIDTPNKEVRILSLQSVDGYFAEDGSNDPVKGLLAITIENTSNQDIYFARLKLKSDKGEDAIFDFSYIKKGDRVLIQERKNRKYISGEKLSFGEINCDFAQSSKRWETNIAEYIELKSEDRQDGNGVAIRNTSKKTVSGIIYYKQRINGILQGGITYRVVIPAPIPAGQTMHVQSFHYNSNSVIVDSELKVS